MLTASVKKRKSLIKKKTYKDILKKSDIERCKEAFMAFDTKKRGKLGMFEIKQLLQDIG